MLARMLMNDSPLAQLTRGFDPRFERQVEHRLNQLFSGQAARSAVMPALNAWQDAAAVHIEAELPGYALENIEILSNQDAVTIRGTREIPTPEGASALRAERVSGSFERTITLPVPIQVDAVVATLRDGVLHITMPLSAEVKARRIAIQS